MFRRQHHDAQVLCLLQNFLRGHLSPRKDHTVNIQHFGRAHHVNVGESRNEHRLVLDKGQHIAHQIASAGALDLLVQLILAAKHPRIQHGNQLLDRHVGSTSYVLPSASYTPLRWFRVESVCRLSFMLKVASLSAASSVSRNEA